MLSPSLQKLPTAEKRFAAQALARPAILLSSGKLVDTPQNWASLLERRQSDRARVAQSTGLLVAKDKQYAGTMFIIAPNLAITSRHVVDFLETAAKEEPAKEEPKRDEGIGSACFGSSVDDCKYSLPIGRMVFKDDVGNAVIELLNHDPVLIPPLPIADPLPKTNEIVGRYAYVVGFSFSDPRLPRAFSERLLGKISGQKRLMPGRILAFSGDSKPIDSKPIFTSDISTTDGTAGGPLVDLSSGEIFGVSYGGVWQGERGKFAYARPVSAKIREIIASRNRGEAIKVTGQ